MKNRKEKRQFRGFLKLISDGKLTESDWEEVFCRLRTLASTGDRLSIELVSKLDSISETVSTPSERMRAVRIVGEEFIAKVMAEAAVRFWRGY